MMAGSPAVLFANSPADGVIGRTVSKSAYRFFEPTHLAATTFDPVFEMDRALEEEIPLEDCFSREFFTVSASGLHSASARDAADEFLLDIFEREDTAELCASPVHRAVSLEDRYNCSNRVPPAATDVYVTSAQEENTDFADAVYQSVLPSSVSLKTIANDMGFPSGTVALPLNIAEVMAAANGITIMHGSSLGTCTAPLPPGVIPKPKTYWADASSAANIGTQSSHAVHLPFAAGSSLPRWSISGTTSGGRVDVIDQGACSKDANAISPLLTVISPLCIKSSIKRRRRSSLRSSPLSSTHHIESPSMHLDNKPKAIGAKIVSTIMPQNSVVTEKSDIADLSDESSVNASSSLTNAVENDEDDDSEDYLDASAGGPSRQNGRGRPRKSETKSARYAREHRRRTKDRRRELFHERDKLRHTVTLVEQQIKSLEEEKVALEEQVRILYQRAPDALIPRFDLLSR